MQSPSLPSLLTFQNGSRVTTIVQWRRRRLELLDQLAAIIYGQTPPAALSVPLRTSIIETNARALDGAATLKRIAIAMPDASAEMNVSLFIPNRRQGATPAIILGCNRGREHIDPTRGNRSTFWPVESIIERGVATAAFAFDDVAPDRDDGFAGGLQGAIDKIAYPTGRPPQAWGKLAAWAWGFSRVVDFLLTEPDIDPGRIGVVGHSRGGKTALWAGANDERIGLTISNDSGCSGAAITRGKAGERIDHITKVFPYWFSQDYFKYAGREEELPVDQHMLLACVAPRRLYVASATEDTWADPAAEWAGAVAATPAWALFGNQGLSGPLPPPESPRHDTSIGHHIRIGAHDLVEYDWMRFIDFMQRA